MAASVSDVVSGRPQSAEILAQVNRLASADRFKDSEAIRKMLLQLGKHAAENPGQTMKEYHIATEALGRGPEFDPKLDSAVRVVASRLRSRLAEYYTHQGVSDPILIDLPKGSYALSCCYRTFSQTQQPAPADVPARRTHSMGAVSFAALLIACMATGAIPAYYFGKTSVLRSNPASVRLFWQDFLQRGEPLIVYSNPAFQRANGDLLRPLNNVTAKAEGSISVYTGVGEVIAVGILSRQLTLLGHDSRIKRSQLFTWDEALKNNLIFVGGPEQSSAMAQLPQLQKFVFAPATSGVKAAVQNKTPLPGEQSLYVPSTDMDNELNASRFLQKDDSIPVDHLG